ncbi:MAG: LPS export ABC transporter ATP-binding protein [Lentisphaeraceae bacterium]|nr:LPS export ABC transporter ATP-binding protein [Lentisphaeraceae bacterium]
MNNIINTVKLTKIYKGRSVVNEVCMDIKEGSITGLLGPNGAGKTTCFYMIVGLVKPNNGNVLFRGENITKLPLHKRAQMGLGYLSQEPSIFRKMSVENNLMSIIEILRIPKEQKQEILEEYLVEFGLGKVRKQLAITLSGGEKRRLEIARVLVNNPSVVLLDEPFSGVDPIAVYDIQQIIIKLKNKGISILITDHNVRETLKITDKAYIMHQGEILCHGTATEIRANKAAREKYLGNSLDEQ